MKKGYWISHVFEIKNQDRWEKYLGKWVNIVEEETKINSGNYKMIAGDKPTKLQGDKVIFAVVIEFNSIQEALDGFNDPRYQDALKQLGDSPSEAVTRNFTITEGM